MTYIFDALEAPIVDGIYKKDDGTKELETLRRLLDGESVSFEHQNIQLKQDLNEPKINIIAPTKFYKTFKELKKEPRVPDNAGENNIISYYHGCFTKYDNLDFDKETLLYKNAKFPSYETEALLLSSLLQKSNNYKEFDKPYLSLEFYVDTRADQNYNIVNRQFTKSISTEERNRYLKRFVIDSASLVAYQAAVVKGGKGKPQSIYSSYDDPYPSDVTTQMKNKIFEKNLPIFKDSPIDGATPDALSNLIDGSPQINSFEDVKAGKFCSYDIVGYVITKKVRRIGGATTLKRTYVLNNKQNFKGVLKYFDSQIKEGEEYSYTIEQINKIYGKTFVKNPNKKYQYPIGYAIGQKDLFKTEKVSYQKVFGPITDANVGFADTEDEKRIPFYNTKNFKVKIPLEPKQTQMVAYSPLSSLSGLESPDIKLNTKIVLMKPTMPEISIFSKKGESKNVLVMLTNIIGRKTKLSGLAAEQKSELKIIDLGTEVDEIKSLTKELRLFRTSEKPRSYDSFPKEPRKILPVENSDFLDDIEPNIVYYYYAESISFQGVKSDPSQVFKMEMVQEQDHVFMLLEVYEFGEDKELIREKLFKKDVAVSPTLLQASIKNMVVGGYIQSKTKQGFGNKLFAPSSQILRPTQNPSHKLRITSKKTRRRFDINVIYSFEEVKQFKEIPASAELVLKNCPKLIADIDLEEDVAPPKTKAAPTIVKNPCCKHISAPSNPLLSSDGEWLIPAFNLTFGNDYPADVKGNFTDFNKTDVEILLNLYDSAEGFLNELDTGDIGESFGTIVGKEYYMSAEMRCYLCRRQPQFMLTGLVKQSLLDFFEDNLEDEAAAKFLKNEINCEQFGLATYRQKPYNVLSCTTDGHGNCKGYKQKAYGLMVKGACKSPMIKVASEAELCEGAREILKVIMKLNKIDPPVYNGKNIIDMTCKEVAIAMNALQG